MGTCNPTVPLWPAASPGSPPHIFLAAVMALGAVIFGRKDGSEVTAQQDRVLNVNRGCSIIFELGRGWERARAKTLETPSGEEKSKEPTIVFRLSAMECTTQKESGTHGIKGNGGNEIQRITVINIVKDDESRAYEGWVYGQYSSIDDI
ncbi:hypothetical protein V496_06820 [Pseudogymnoascus sp. VKM F-4515 (FW-2607)]|nr:hypothetical protein V496_06820 [Pseudogymnoascus sp. VKM F-4515 (FW-2607)]